MMNALAPFVPATPAIIVGRTFGGQAVPLGLDEPFALLGGDRLGPEGIPLHIMHEHQPEFLHWVRHSCGQALAAERPWFHAGPLLLTGAEGAGRTHAARWLARVAGVPHVVLNLTDPVIAANVASTGGVSEALWASPITVAMAASRCANPIISVIGADRMTDDVAFGFEAMMDPVAGRSWREDCLGICVDLGEVTWILQCSQMGAIPPSLRRRAPVVALEAPPSSLSSVRTLSIMLEAMGDLGLAAADPALSWQRVRVRLTRWHSPTAKELYSDMIGLLPDLVLEPGGDEQFHHDEDPF